MLGHLHRLEKSQNFSIDQIECDQLNNLNKLLRHAKNTCDFYQDLPESITSLDEIKHLPFLEKSDLRKHAVKIRSQNAGKFVRSKTTGGSTGAAVTIYKDAAGMAKELAATWRGYRWAGVDIGDKQARFWGVPQDKSSARMAKTIDFITHRIRFSAFDFSSAALSDYVSSINKKQPIYFYGYVSLLRELALHIDSGQAELKCFPLAVFTTSEVLSVEDRALLQRVFRSRVYNEYGCGEVGTIAHECVYGNMHITAENMILECLDEQGISSSEGELVVTDLVNFAMPLIRYRIKDFGVVQASNCECGSHLPVLSKVYGREYDILINREGKKFHGEFFLYVIEDLKKLGISIDGVQFVQIKRNEILVNISCSERNKKDIEETITQYLISNFHKCVSVRYEYHDSLPRESSGKLRVVKRDCEVECA